MQGELPGTLSRQQVAIARYCIAGALFLADAFWLIVPQFSVRGSWHYCLPYVLASPLTWWSLLCVLLWSAALIAPWALLREAIAALTGLVLFLAGLALPFALDIVFFAWDSGTYIYPQHAHAMYLIAAVAVLAGVYPCLKLRRHEGVMVADAMAARAALPPPDPAEFETTAGWDQRSPTGPRRDDPAR
ncbi:MAG: hypothetical protein ACREJ2_15370 [Planctomycetota bacterium]